MNIKDSGSYWAGLSPAGADAKSERSLGSRQAGCHFWDATPEPRRSNLQFQEGVATLVSEQTCPHTFPPISRHSQVLVDASRQRWGMDSPWPSKVVIWPSRQVNEYVQLQAQCLPPSIKVWQDVNSWPGKIRLPLMTANYRRNGSCCPH